MRALLIPTLLATALLAGCSDAGDSASVQGEDPARFEAAQADLPAPVSLHVEGDIIGSAGESWSWGVADLAPSVFYVYFEFSPAAMPGPGYVLQQATVRLVDPQGGVQGEYTTPFTVGQFQQTALDFSSPPYADVADGNWTVELSAVQGLAHYILDVEVGYEGASGEVTDGT